jgi:hypothetical protein
VDPWRGDAYQLLGAAHLDTGDLVSAHRSQQMLADLGVPAGQRGGAL